MPSLKALWKPLAAVDTLQRSSHGLAVVQNTAYVFGGELKPRTPVDASITTIDLSAGSVETLSASSSSLWPASRVGHTFTAASDGKVYLWGGRGGKDMSSFSGDTSIWRFDPTMKGWEELETKGDQPEARSFHTMTSADGKLYLHAGCPASGRLPTLHSLDLTSLTWSTLPSAPDPGRGGTVLAALPSSASSSSRILARFGGFAGYELGGFDVYDVEKGEWTALGDLQVEGGGEGPGKRSVYSLVGLEGTLDFEGKKVVAVMTLGERDAAPKELGHDGAGFFHDDGWALLSSGTAAPAFSWLRLESSSKSEGQPEARGWFASSFVAGNKIALQGGLNSKNERLSDGWTLEVVVE
ncbi:hypothetical protein JCM6882_003333 [Rhodosporidiobolus microsporus]